MSDFLLAFINAINHPFAFASILFSAGFYLSFILYEKLHFLSPETYDNSDYRRAKAGKHGLVMPSDIYHEYGWVENSKGQLLFNQKWLPLDASIPVLSVIVLCHGFGDHSAGFLSQLAVKFARLGYGVVSIDYIGHGRSDGLHALIYNVDDLAQDVADYLDNVFIRKENLQNKNVFLYGESLGGAVAFKICTSPTAKKYIKGVVLMSPMIKISDKFKPPEIVVKFFKKIRSIFPWAPIAPVPDIIEKCFKLPHMVTEARADPIAYKKSPRLASAVAMMRATDQIAAHMEDLTHPVLILHGEADVVTAPELSQELYNRCSSTDKTLKIYPTCWHNLLVGEPEDIAKHIFDDAVNWLNDHQRKLSSK